MTIPAVSPLRPIKYRIEVAFLPTLLKSDAVVDRTVVLTDVLRATTTIIQALHNGCLQVIPQSDIEAARQLHSHTENSVLGGERSGQIIPGFHHGNSPVEYSRAAITGKSLILATTNGTVALEHCRNAAKVLIGGLVNLSAVANMIKHEKAITIVCSGTDGEATSEDVLFAGALVEKLLSDQPDSSSCSSPDDPIDWRLLNDAGKIALNHWLTTRGSADADIPLAESMKSARGGINLVKIGHEADIHFASQIDTVPVVPQLNVESWTIQLTEN